MLKKIEASHYSIYVGMDILNTDEWQAYWKICTKKIVVISDSNVAECYFEKIKYSFQNLGLSPLFFSFPAGEQFKTRETKQVLEDKMLFAGCARDTILLAVGGGVTCDLVGFLASTYCRGVPVVYMPSSLMGMVDASVGGKTGVNTPYGKNLIGGFSFPASVWMSIDWLKTLPEADFLSGMAEVLKHAFISGDEHVQWLVKHHQQIVEKDESVLMEMIWQSCQIKNAIVKQDAYESGYRQILNFGHTIGHAIEAYEDYQWSHGDAVALGMRIEVIIAMLLGVLPKEHVKNIHEVIHLFGLIKMSHAVMDIKHIEKWLLRDKKNKNQQIHVVLLEKLGMVYSEGEQYSFPVNDDVIEAALQYLVRED